MFTDDDQQLTLRVQMRFGVGVKRIDGRFPGPDGRVEEDCVVGVG